LVQEGNYLKKQPFKVKNVLPVLTEGVEKGGRRKILKKKGKSCSRNGQVGRWGDIVSQGREGREKPGKRAQDFTKQYQRSTSKQTKTSLAQLVREKNWE